MTTDPWLEQLRQMTNVHSAAAKEAFRPKTRHPLKNWTGHVHIKGVEQRVGVRQDGETWENEVVALQITKLRDVVAEFPLGTDEAELDIRLSDRKNSEIGMTVASAKEVDPTVESFVDLNDREWSVIETVKNLGPGKPLADGRPGYDINVFYYKIVSLGPRGAAASNGTAAPAKEVSRPTDQQIAMMLAYAAGRTQAEFYGPELFSYMKEQDLLDPDCQAYIVSRRFLKDMADEGRLVQDTDGKYQLQPTLPF